MSSMYEEAIRLAEIAEAQIDKTIANLEGCECPVCEMIAATMEAAKRNMAEQRSELTELTLGDPEGAAPLIAAGAIGIFGGYVTTAELMEKLSDEAHRAYNILSINTLSGMGAVDTPSPTQPMPKGWN